MGLQSGRSAVVLTGKEQDEAAGEEVRVGAEPGHSDGHGLRQRVAHGVVGESVDVVAESSSDTRRSYSNRNNSINSIIRSTYAKRNRLQ